MRKHLEISLFGLTYIAACLTTGVLCLLIGYMVVNGVIHFDWKIFSPVYTSDNVSLVPSFIATIEITVLALIMAVPIGIFSAIYLVEYAKRGSRVVAFIKLTTETLAGIPSIIYGLFGMLFFVTTLQWGFSLIAGACTLAIMILPFMIRTTEESLKTVPDSFREGSFSLGAGQIRTIFKVVLPSATPGILAGVILAVGRIMGETAALIYTAGTVAQSPTSLTDSARTLAVHMYSLSSEGLHTGASYTTGLVLLILVVGMNMIASSIAKKVMKGK